MKRFPKWFQVLHFISGYITFYAFFLSWFISLMMFIGFILYEFWEFSIIRDEIFRDVRDYMSGFYTGFLSYVAVEVVKNIYVFH